MGWSQGRQRDAFESLSWCLLCPASQEKLPRHSWVLRCPSSEDTTMTLPEGSWNVGAAGTQRGNVPLGDVTWGSGLTPTPPRRPRDSLDLRNQGFLGQVQ